ncbi:MAG: hypothetical protein M9948_11390 [Lentimicrobium sp.]|nr:hypothetical protein [Lentimicrobium sp.]HPG34101.1 hypothetical protein [Lentimicrobium sp.]
MSFEQGKDFSSRLKASLKSRNTIKNIAALIIGAIAGYIYYVNVGCSTGGCAITSNPYMTVLWGGLLGYLFADIFKIKDKTTEQEK